MTLSSAAYRRTSRPAPARIDWAIGLVAGSIVAVCAVALAAGSVWISRKPEAERTTVGVTIGTASTKVPASWIVGPRPSLRHATERLDLAIPWADLDPTAERVAEDGSHLRIFVSLAPAQGQTPPGERPALIYGRFLSSDAKPAAGGLVRRSFRAGSPFEDEEMYLAPEGRGFAARCLTAGKAEGIGAACLTEWRAAGLDIQVRFPPALLEHWEGMTRQIRRALAVSARD